MAEREIIISSEEFPSNSFRSREEKREIKKVVKAGVKQKKESLGRRITGAVFEEDTKSVGGYIFWDVLIPAAKSLLSDIVTNGIEMILYGKEGNDSRNNVRRERTRSYVSYDSYYDREGRRRDRNMYRASRARHDFDDVLFSSRTDAETVLSELVNIVDEYDSVSVSDFYELTGIETNYTDRNWGWTSLGGAYVERVRDGYIIKLPRTIALD